MLDLVDQPGQARVRQADAGRAADQTCAEAPQRGPSAQWWNTHLLTRLAVFSFISFLVSVMPSSYPPVHPQFYFFYTRRHKKAHVRWKPWQDDAGESHRVPERGHDVSVIFLPSVINPQVEILHRKCKKCLNRNWMEVRGGVKAGGADCQKMKVSVSACVCSSP